MKNKDEINDIILELQNIDYNLIFGLITPVVCTYGSLKMAGTYQLYKDLKIKDLSKVYLPEQVIAQHNSIEINKSIDEKLQATIMNFASTLSKCFDISDLNNFYNNIKTLTVDNKDFKINSKMQQHTIASYNVLNNKINIGNEQAIYHELFHLASSQSIDLFNCRSGFFQASKGFSIGRGINEGYTELLTDRYFPNEKKDGLSYPYESLIMEQLELIVNPSKMSSFYLQANLLGLINELNKYTTKEEIAKFLTYMDFVNKYIGTNTIIPFKKRKISYCLENINDFLLNTYITKFTNLLNKKLISKDDFTMFISRFVLLMMQTIDVIDNIYNISFKDYLNDSLLKKLEEYNDVINMIDEFLEYHGQAKCKTKEL